MNETLITADVSQAQIALRPESVLERDSLVAELARHSAITTAEEATAATAAVKTGKAFLKRVEDCRKAIKAPVLELGKKIDALADELAASVTGEVVAVERCLNTYSAELRRLAREAETARLAILKKQADELAAAQTAQKAAHYPYQKEAAQAQMREAVARHPGPVAVSAPPKLAGVVTKTVYELEVKDLAGFFAMFPDFCRIELRAREAQAAVKAGVIPLGDNPLYRAWSEERTEVR